MVIGTAALLAGWYSGLVSLPGDHLGYERILRWEIPGGERWFIAVDPRPASEELRALGDRLRKDLRHLDNAVVMVFDDPEAARQVYQGSRNIGETPFQKAILHQRAMYIKSSGRSEDRLSIYDTYPGVQEVVRYDSVPAK
jgi:hypothetical protein